ncbi:MAG: FAD-dependent oxidoreductase [Bauldia sp.]|nr:FAD-dependent oxidoreductase [Bauldia sp.]
MAGSTKVLIVGAGPTGLVLALWLTRQGVPVRIIDKDDGPGETSRAMAVQARTLELYRQLDLADEVVAAGSPNPSFNLWVGGQRRAHVKFAEAGGDVTPYPFVLVYPQDEHERLLVERLRRMGVEVERRTELLDFRDDGERVLATLRQPDGGEETVEAEYLAGCDGASSLVRHRIGATFAGGTYPQVFYVADVAIQGLEPADEIHVALDSADFVAVLSYGGGGRHRLIGTVRGERAEDRDALTFDDISGEAIQHLGLSIDRVNWFSTYRVHHRVTDRFRGGRAFLVGDAAHIHSPAGGQGMNTGIADAINLAWKLAAVVNGEAADALLDSYEAERLAFARRLVETTDRVFAFASSDGTFADFVRTRIAPFFASTVFQIEAVREFMFRVVSQTSLDYRHSPLSHGAAGDLRGGDRMPWTRIDGSDNFAPFADIGWQVHVYGAASPELAAWCRERSVPLHVFAWQESFASAGLVEDALYLVRPDTYVAVADAEGDVAAVAGYFDRAEFRTR